jgi:hypothetical protein
VSQNSPISGMEFFFEIEDLPFLISSPFGSTHFAHRHDERFSSTLSYEEDDQVPSGICRAKRRINIFSSPVTLFNESEVWRIREDFPDFVLTSGAKLRAARPGRA